MEHGALTEETNRFDVALAAAEAAGKEIHMISGPLHPSRRSYFYAVEEGSGDYDVRKLSILLKDEKIPVLVDWDRSSHKFGLKYTIAGTPMSSNLRSFQSKDAKKQHSTWFIHNRNVNKVLIRAATDAAKGQSMNYLESEMREISFKPTKPHRVNEL